MKDVPRRGSFDESLAMGSMARVTQIITWHM